MELDILHRAVAPEIVEFYGAFFIESCVYYCMEYMDAGSLDKLQGAGVPEDVLARIASRMVTGLKFLKDDLQIMHRGILSCCFLMPPPHPQHFRVSRRQTHQCAGQQKGGSQTLRLWCFRTVRKITSQDQYWMPKLHGCKSFSCRKIGCKLTSFISPKE